ncbi:Iron-regulated transporter [Coniochaeta hoffmannii]|uniref:Solute carrier family 40 member n=1 Tax=Coniochaeta hoffmannii TaxID=91930 RepID=A0AA38VQ23_9PEZI|nr:Iron-regulated transporter [Coniochaeta hoffmannii]
MLLASADHIDADADEHLLPQPSPGFLPRSLTARLYTSHFLSTWNSRLFEFGAVLFLADIFPSSLLPLSVYALMRSAAVILGAQAVGEVVDRAAKSVGKKGRLEVVRSSIVGGRVAVVGSCGILLLLGKIKSGGKDAGGLWTGSMGGSAPVLGLFVVLIVLACVEKLCATMNLVAVERDWVVVMTDGNDAARQSLNARMRRIDLLCKLVGPLAIASIDVVSTTVAIWTTLGLNFASIFPEYICIAQVHDNIPSLHQSSSTLDDQDDTREQTLPAAQPSTTWLKSSASRLLPLKSLPYYIHHPAFLPSFSLCLLYLTVLSLSGQMVTYLLSIGYTSLHVGIIRFISTIFELSATWIAPWLMRRIGVVRSAIWSLSWQMIWLAAGAGWFFADIRGQGTGSIAAATGLVVGVAFSRVGLWSYDLCAQSIIQEEVEGDHRGSFSTVEAAFQNLFELASYATTIVFSRPDQFRWPVVISIAAVYVAGGLYASFVRQRRGHLFHRPACVCLEKGESRETSGYA